MKKILLMLTVILVGLVSCSKDESNTTPEVKTGDAFLKFVVNAKLASGQTVEEEFKMPFVMIWRAEGKDYEYNGLGDKNYAVDKKTGNAVKADYEYINIRSKIVKLLPGKYFIAILTDLDTSPRLAHSYTTFTIESNKVKEVKKNVSSMVSNKYTPW